MNWNYEELPDAVKFLSRVRIDRFYDAAPITKWFTDFVNSRTPQADNWNWNWNEEESI